MLDQDVVMLQLGAALMNANDYLINLINKFQLTSWAEKGFDCAEDESVRQVITLVEEFLSCLIMVVSERYTPGVGQVTSEDSIRREIIQLLCEEPMSHSDNNCMISRRMESSLVT
jgi:E3 ubiquitin-protein ligase UBR2